MNNIDHFFNKDPVAFANSYLSYLNDVLRKMEYGPAEDAHMVLDHLIGAYLMRWVKTE